MIPWSVHPVCKWFGPPEHRKKGEKRERKVGNGKQLRSLPVVYTSSVRELNDMHMPPKQAGRRYENDSRVMNGGKKNICSFDAGSVVRDCILPDKCRGTQLLAEKG